MVAVAVLGCVACRCIGLVIGAVRGHGCQELLAVETPGVVSEVDREDLGAALLGGGSGVESQLSRIIARGPVRIAVGHEDQDVLGRAVGIQLRVSHFDGRFKVGVGGKRQICGGLLYGSVEVTVGSPVVIAVGRRALSVGQTVHDICMRVTAVARVLCKSAHTDHGRSGSTLEVAQQGLGSGALVRKGRGGHAAGTVQHHDDVGIDFAGAAGRQRRCSDRSSGGVAVHHNRVRQREERTRAMAAGVVTVGDEVSVVCAYRGGRGDIICLGVGANGRIIRFMILARDRPGRGGADPPAGGTPVIGVVAIRGHLDHSGDRSA